MKMYRGNSVKCAKLNIVKELEQKQSGVRTFIAKKLHGKKLYLVDMDENMNIMSMISS